MDSHRNINNYYKLNKLSITLFLIVISVALLSAQDASSYTEMDKTQFHIKKIEIEGEFLNSNVRCAHKDSRGFMWFGTAQGVCRYDGNEIIEFTTNNSKLPFNDVYVILEDDQGYLWICSRSTLLKPEDAVLINIHSLEIYNLSEKVDTGKLPLNTHLREGNDHVIYFMNKEGVQYVYANGKWEKGLPIVNGKDLTNEKDLYDIFKYYEDRGIDYLVYDEKQNYSAYNLGLTENDHVIVYSFDFRPERGLHVNKEIEQLGPSGEKSSLFDRKLKKKALPDSEDKVIRRNDETENIWVVDNYSFVLCNGKENTFYDFKLKHPEIFHDRILGMEFYDGLIWVCAANGLFTIEIKNDYFDRHLYAKSFREGFNSCRSIYTKDNETLLVASVNELIQLNSNGEEKIIRKGKYSPFMGARGDTLLLTSRLIHSFVNGKMTTIAGIEGDNTAWSAERDKNKPDRYWLGFSDVGLGYWEIGMDTAKIYRPPSPFEELERTAVYDIFSMDNGHVLVVSHIGIYEISLEENYIQRYWTGGDKEHYLPLNEYYHIHQDKEGLFWLSSGGGGLIKWNKETGEYQQYTTDNGFSSNVICATYEDEQENLWIPSYNGLIRFNKETEDIRIYKTEDGLTHNEFNRESHFQAPDGKLYFGGINGVNSFYPNELLAEEKNPSVPLEITSVKHFDSGDDELIDKFELFKTKGKIAQLPGEGYINIGFSLLDYKKKDITTYAYKIEGQSEQWQYIKDNQLRISGLPYGEYQLRIKGQMSNGNFSDKELLMPLDVLRPFYMKWWFILASALMLVFAIYQFFWWRNKWLVKRGEELEKQVDEQTQQLQKDKAIIEKQATELKEIDKLKSRFFANVSHELRTPITLIQGPVRAVLNNENLGKDDQFLLNKVEENTEHLLSMVNELMDLTKAEAYKLKLNESPVVLYDLLKRRLSSFQSLADMKSIQFDFEYHLDKDLAIALDVDKFEKIINNLLSNAFKFTPKKGKIGVAVNEEKNNLLFEVKDSGRGIPEKDVPFVFERFYQSSINKKAEGGLGIGLSLSMEFVKLLGGSMWVTSKEGIGTSFFVSIPKKEVEHIASKELDSSSVKEEPVKSRISPLAPQIKSESDINSEFLSKQMILIVEDNFDLQEYLHYLLSPHYEEVHVVGNGKEALDWMAAHKFPSLILSDLMMPIMDGFEFLEKVKADKRMSSIPFVMLTARAELKDKLQALRIGVDDYLTKPFKEEELKVRINNLLSNFEERREYLLSEEFSQNTTKKEFLPETSEDDRLWLENLEKTIIAEIEHHHFSVDYLAEKIDIKRDKLFKKTKALTGLTPNKYVRTVRLQLAKELLEKKTYKTVKEVAQKVGFQKIEYFSSLYKKQFGKSPSEYLR